MRRRPIFRTDIWLGRMFSRVSYGPMVPGWLVLLLLFAVPLVLVLLF